MTKVLDMVNADPNKNIKGAWTPPSKQVSGSGKKSLAKEGKRATEGGRVLCRVRYCFVEILRVVTFAVKPR